MNAAKGFAVQILLATWLVGFTSADKRAERDHAKRFLVWTFYVAQIISLLVLFA